MGERSQIFIRYKDNGLLAYQMKYVDGPGLVDTLLYVADHRDELLNGGDEQFLIGENIQSQPAIEINPEGKQEAYYPSIWNRSNQCGKLFIDIGIDGAIKYCFTDSEDSYPPGNQSPLDVEGYLDWCRTTYDGDPTWIYSPETYRERIEKYSLLSLEELIRFIDPPYEKEKV